MKQLISRRSFLKAAGVTTAVAAVSLGAPAASACYPGSFKDITILYTNDVHTYIDKKSPELTYAAIAALKKSYQDAGKNVLLVDAGDHIQGTAYGSMDEGASIIQLMNAAGYDVATPGNHEFDYGMARAKEVMAEADFPYLSSNWVNLPLGNRVLPDVKYFTIGGRVIAFVGITTPETFTKSTPAYFMDKSQSRYIYDILGGDDGQKLYKAVQKSIDKAKVLADYVIGLGHLGVDPSSSPWTSKEVIEHTSGFDAFIDGHSHTKMECEWVKDLSGKAVALTQTGSYFANVGEMTIKADGSIATRLISSYEGSDSAVADIQNAWVASVDDMLGEKIAVADTNFYISDPETGKRRIRMAETNLGDFVAEAAKRLGMAQPTLANKLRLLQLNADQRQFVLDNSLTERHARAVLRLPENRRSEALINIAKRRMNARQTDLYIEQLLNTPAKGRHRISMVKDVRIFVNTIDHAIRLMTDNGVPATAHREEKDGYIEYTVRIPTTAAER